MRLIVKGLWSDVIDAPLDNYAPPILDCFGFWLNFRVGPCDEDGVHDYQVFVCTPDWIRRKCQNDFLFWGRHVLLISYYDIDLIRDGIERCVKDSVQGVKEGDCLGAYREIAKFASWEFEDYKI